jgi:LacI family transcriptional regulator
MLAIKEMGLRCPDEIAIVGFDDHPWAAVASPPLTVVSQPARDIGCRAAQMLGALVRGEPVETPHVELGCTLVVRDSS